MRKMIVASLFLFSTFATAQTHFTLGELPNTFLSSGQWLCIIESSDIVTTGADFAIKEARESALELCLQSSDNPEGCKVKECNRHHHLSAYHTVFYSEEKLSSCTAISVEGYSYCAYGHEGDAIERALSMCERYTQYPESCVVTCK